MFITLGRVGPQKQWILPQRCYRCQFLRRIFFQIFIVLSPQLEEAKLCDGITELQLQNYLVPSLPLSCLVDDDFIAGFCHRGSLSSTFSSWFGLILDSCFMVDASTPNLAMLSCFHPNFYSVGICFILGVVDIIPLAHHNDLEVFVRKNMLTINMSASVYSAFGLAGVKFMCNNRKMYHFNIHLGWPTFKRNDNAHMRLRNFFNSEEVTSRRPPGPCVVRWAVNKNIDWTRVENGGLPEAPHPYSLARFLAPDFRIAIPTVEVCNLEAGAEVPRFIEANSSVDHPSGSSVDHESARIAHSTLQQMAAGVYPANDSYLSPLSSRRVSAFAPGEAICLRGATILTISGIFTLEQCQKLEDLLTQVQVNLVDVDSSVLCFTLDSLCFSEVVRTSPSENSVAFFASRQIESDWFPSITEKKKDGHSPVFFQKLLAPVFTASRPYVLTLNFVPELTCEIKE
ncbi:unnamed protein product [Hydatigera taeniaeformis]|uniref:Uncharacterized protein n=1 Tax=Hydatigena taeniaeformis TaxID=6205 RepID=A0A3P7FW55_HYDTA|nr:unnamed protein product [Hydatigera taeniaeformis]